MKNLRLGIYLLNLRKRAGLTKTEAAEKLKIVDKSVIDSWEAGIKVPSRDYSSLIAQAYNVPEIEVSEILIRENAMTT